MTKYLLALLFSICVPNSNAEISAISGGGSSGLSLVSGGTFGNGAAISIPHLDVFTSSHPCRVIQSTMTAAIPGATGTNNSLVSAYVVGSSISLSGVNAGSFARFCGSFLMSRNNNSGPILGLGPMLTNGTSTTIIGKSASVTFPLWTTQGILNTRQPIGACYTHPTTLTAGTWTAGLHAFIDTADTWTFYGGVNAQNWFVFQEVSCAD